MRTTYGGTFKEFARQQSVTAGKVYNHVLDLPGPECRSIARLLNHGLVTKATRFTLIEVQQGRIPAIENRMTRLGLPNYTILNMEVHTCCPTGIDWANVDTCNSLSHHLLDWLGTLSLADNGELNVWLTCFRNNGRFRESMCDTFLRKREGVRLLNCLTRECDGLLQYEPKPYQVASMLSIVSVMAQRYRFHVQPVYPYRDGQDMFLVRLTDMHASKPWLPAPTWVADEDYVSGNWRNNTPPELSIDDSITETLLKVVCGKNNTGQRAFLSHRLRHEQEAARAMGSNPERVRAGWKAHITKTCKEHAIVAACHNIIDAQKLR